VIAGPIFTICAIAALATIGLTPRRKVLPAIVPVTPARERSKMAMPITRSSFRMFRLNVDCSMSKARAARQKAAVVRGCDGVAKLTDVKGHAQSSPSGRKRSFVSTITSPIGFRDPKSDKTAVPNRSGWSYGTPTLPRRRLKRSSHAAAVYSCSGFGTDPFLPTCTG